MMGRFGFGGIGLIGMIFCTLIIIGVIVGVILLIVWAVRKSSKTNHQSNTQTLSSQTAKEIAQTRYAKGEITRDEYQQILADLGK